MIEHQTDKRQTARRGDEESSGQHGQCACSRSGRGDGGDRPSPDPGERDHCVHRSEQGSAWLANAAKDALRGHADGQRGSRKHERLEQVEQPGLTGKEPEARDARCYLPGHRSYWAPPADPRVE